MEAAILYEAQRRSVYGDRSLEGIARRFEISLRQAQKYALVWRLFFARDGQNSEHEEADSQVRGSESVNVDAFWLDGLGAGLLMLTVLTVPGEEQAPY